MKSSPITPRTQINIYILIIVIVWTLTIGASLVWNILQIKQSTMDNALVQARVAFAKDVVYRRWASMQGGVYVPINDMTPPNPYLADLPERDITTPSGIQLTLINPAYMTRQVQEIEQQESGVRGHITSLNPIRPENAADEWEIAALESFEKGIQETSGLAIIEGKEYLRLMRPLVAEKDCLLCHAKQGYKEGEIRGGLSTSVPMRPLLNIETVQIQTVAIAHGVIGLLGLLGTAWGAQRIAKIEVQRAAAEELLRYQSNHDAATGLYNRAFFEEEMKRLESSRMFPISIIIADVDDLKVVNDTRGHSAGDELLKHAAKVLKSSIRDEDIIARIGGDEFAILLPLTDADSNVECLARIKNMLTVYRTECHMDYLSFSLGGATALEENSMLHNALLLADERMYQEKRARKKPSPENKTIASGIKLL